MDNKLVLIFTPNNPFPPRHGAHHRVVQQLLDLAPSYKIILASSNFTTDIPWPTTPRGMKKLCNDHSIESIYIYEDSITYKFYQLGHALFRRLYQRTKLVVFLSISSALNDFLMALWLRAISLRFDFSAIIIHYSRWAHLAQGIKGPTKAIELHDILPLNKFLSVTISDLLESGHYLSANQDNPLVSYIDNAIQIPLTIQKEIQRDIRILNKYDIVWMISQREEQLLQRLGLRTKSLLIHPVVDILPSSDHKYLPPLIPIGPNCFNVYSLLVFINEVLPLIDPSIWDHNRIIVSGDFGNYTHSVKLNHPLYGIGFVDDYKSLLLRSSLMIVPTAVGTGQQIKIYEALAAGIPIISYRSSVSSDLVDRCPSIIAVDSHRQFAECLAAFLSDSSLRRKYTHLAYSFAIQTRTTISERRYSESLANALFESSA